MTIHNYIKEKKAVIDDFLLDRLSEYEKSQPALFFSSEIIKKLREMITRGKSLRGIMVLLSYELNGGKDIKTILPVAAAIELFHAGFLIHDDIMDNDELRRGLPTMHHSFALWAKSQQMDDPKKFGINSAICVGDICVFLGNLFLMESSMTAETLKKISLMLQTELITTCNAQMTDVYFGMSDYEPGKEEIMELYRYKSARYTFSLPLMVGAIASNCSDDTLEKLDKFGDTLGILFQIKDDALGIFGTNETGKPLYSDISENKKTFIRYLLLQNLTIEEKKRIMKIFGKSTLDVKDKTDLKQIMIKYAINEKIETEMQNLTIQAEKDSERITDDPKYKLLLKEFIILNTTRTK